jgi:signal transduction histidine kinase
MNIAAIRNLSLQRKFVLVTSIAVIVLMILLGLLITRRESFMMYRNTERQGRLLAETLAIPIMNDLLYERLGFVEEGGLIDTYVTEIIRNKNIDLLYIAVLDEKGIVIAHNDFNEYGKVYDDPITTKAFSSQFTVVQKFIHEPAGHEALDFATPLSIGKKRFGTLKLAISLERVKDEVQVAIRVVLLFTLLFLCCGFIIIFMLSKRFIIPITQMARTMEQASGDMLDVRMKTEGGDEIALLGISFNRMIDRIRESNTELKRTHEKLLQFARTMEKAGGDMLDVKVDLKDIGGKDEIALLGQSFNKMIGRIKQANMELKQTHEKLLQSEKLASVGILAAGVAHEINNPLGGLFNCVRMLEEGKRDESGERYYALLKEGLQRIETTVGKLLWMSRKQDKKPVLVSINDSLDVVFDFLGYNMTKKGITYTRNMEEGVSVFIDPVDLQQILINLVANAIQSMENGGTLDLRAHRNRSKVIIEITDSGEGISRENISRVFDPFFTTKKPGAGTGLGLWLTYEIAKNNNGEISVRSEPGKGTKVTLSFPEGRSA